LLTGNCTQKALGISETQAAPVCTGRARPRTNASTAKRICAAANTAMTSEDGPHEPRNRLQNPRGPCRIRRYRLRGSAHADDARRGVAVSKPPQPGQTVLYRMPSGSRTPFAFVVESADGDWLSLRGAMFPSSKMVVRWRFASGKRNLNVTLRKEHRRDGDAAGRLGLRKVD